MELRNLKKALDHILGPFADSEKEMIIQAVKLDLKESVKTESGSEIDVLLSEFNTIFKKRSRVVSGKVANRMKNILKHFTIDEVVRAMRNASEDDFHKDSGYKYCTMEYFSRIEQIDKWINVSAPVQQSSFVLPKMNVKA